MRKAIPSLVQPYLGRLHRAFAPLESIEWQAVLAVQEALDGELAKGSLGLGAYLLLLRAVEEADRDDRLFLLSQGATSITRCRNMAEQVDHALSLIYAARLQRIEEALLTRREYLETLSGPQREPVMATLEAFAADEIRGSADSLSRPLLIRAIRLAGRTAKPLVFNDAIHALRIRGAAPRLLRSLIIFFRQLFSAKE